LCGKPPNKTVDVSAEEADDESSDRERKKQLGPPKEKHKKEAATSSNANDRTFAITGIFFLVLLHQRVTVVSSYSIVVRDMRVIE